MENYEPNSHKYKKAKAESENNTEKKKIEKVVSGTAKLKKKSEIRKFTDIFIAEDASKVKTYILSDVIVPAAKKLISDIVKDGIEMILYGGTDRGGRRSNGFRADYVSYNKYSERRDDRRGSDSRTRTGYSYDDIILETRGEAEEVLSRMDELIDMYGMVTVADLYDLVGVSGNYTDNKYGWVNIRNAEPVRVQDGYMLKLPKALPLD
jgi:hypothetical protein